MLLALSSSATSSTGVFLAEVIRLQRELEQLDGQLDRLAGEVRRELNHLAREVYEYETSH
jgi:hypothetical protein